MNSTAFSGNAPSPLVPPNHRGFTITDVARRHRVRRAKVLGWINSGQLAAINTADPLSRPRYVVLPESLTTFERRRTATPNKRAPRRRRQRVAIDYFPD
jgi:hypothetical protein